MPADQRGEGGPAGPPRSRAAINVERSDDGESFLAGQPTARDGGEPYQVGVSVDARVLIDDDLEGACELDECVALAPETVRRLLCDASTMAIARGCDGEPLTVSRKSTPFREPRDGRYARDQGCRFPGCGERSFVDVHHIRHHAAAVATRSPTSSNCAGSTIGSSTKAAGTSDSTRRNAITSANTTAGLAIDAKTITPRWYGDPLHLGEIVGGLEWLNERGEVAWVATRWRSRSGVGHLGPAQRALHQEHQRLLHVQPVRASHSTTGTLAGTDSASRTSAGGAGTPR